MEHLITIDTGKNMGIAVFRNAVLLQAGLLTAVSSRELTKGLFQLCDDVEPQEGIVEIPQIYPQSKWKGDPNDLINVAVLAGIAVAALSPFCEVKQVFPHTWKGSRPKNVDNAYTYSLLYEAERQVLAECGVIRSHSHNIMDAIGIGLWHLKRR